MSTIAVTLMGANRRSDLQAFLAVTDALGMDEDHPIQVHNTGHIVASTSASVAAENLEQYGGEPE